MALITVAFYEDRYGSGDATQVQGFIDDVSAEVVDYVSMLDTDSDNPITPEDWDETTAPAAVKAAVARIVNRAIGNPFGISQEGLGDHQRTFSVGAAGGMMSPKDKRIIRRAAGAFGVQNAQLEGYLPLEPETLETDLVL